MDILENARRYLDRMPAAISGQGGHNTTFEAACVLVWGFALSEHDAFSLLSEWNRRCSPPWSDPDLAHKLRDAANPARHQKPRGYLLNARSTYSPGPRSYPPAPKAHPEPVVKPIEIDLTKGSNLPQPLPDGAIQLLKAAFQDGESVRICQATTNAEGKEIPNGAGVTMPRAWWLGRLEEEDGDPNGIFTQPGGEGIYITVNPMREDGSKDDHVTSYRHTLIEFDSIPVDAQWALYKSSGLPITAVIHSGGKSLHAWVRVDATTRREYDERVAILHKYFEKYQLDVKNKNPSRFSRLAGCRRFDRRQELISLRMGAESFSAWVADRQADSIGQECDLEALLDFVPAEDPDCLLGDRLLCKQGSMLVVGASGIGKSSFSTQAAVLWALGRPAFGIAPKRSMRVLIVQAENDSGDTAEMLQGVTKGLGINRFGDDMETILQNLKIVRDTTHTGDAFLSSIRKLIDKHKPDLVVLDPLLSFIGDDISKQEVCGKFLRNGLNPIAEATGIAWVMMHHTGKPPKMQNAKAAQATESTGYEAFGSSELINWARSVLMVRPQIVRKDGVNEKIFCLEFTKRGKRAGWVNAKGFPANTKWMKHSDRNISWVDAEEPAAPEKKVKPESPYKRIMASETLGGFVDLSPGEGELEQDVVDRLVEHCKTSMLLDESDDEKKFWKACRQVVYMLTRNGRLSKVKGEDKKMRYFKVV